MGFIDFIICPFTTVKNCTIVYKNTKVRNIFCQILINPHKIAKDILVYAKVAKFGHTDGDRMLFRGALRKRSLRKY